MNIELFQQDPGLFFMSLLVSLIITVLAYGAFPIIFAKTRKKPITYKKYKWLCFGINFIILSIFFVSNGGASNGVPYLLWTWIFLRYGEKTLGLRGIMQESDYFKKPLNPLVRCKSCGYEGRFGQKCPRCQNVGLIETIEEINPSKPEKIITNDNKVATIKSTTIKLTADLNNEVKQPKHKKPIKVKYCSKCGNLIDNETKVCTGCGKKYFKGIRLNKFSIVIIVFVLAIGSLAGVNIYQYYNNSRLIQSVSYLESTVKTKDTYISQLQERLKESQFEVYDLEKELDFYEDYAACVNENSKKYHTHNCEDFDTSSFWIYNINAAEDRGYYACSKCH